MGNRAYGSGLEAGKKIVNQENLKKIEELTKKVAKRENLAIAGGLLAAVATIFGLSKK